MQLPGRALPDIGVAWLQALMRTENLKQSVVWD